MVRKAACECRSDWKLRSSPRRQALRRTDARGEPRAARESESCQDCDKFLRRNPAARSGARQITMPLSIGTRLGPYEILAPLAAGGMGEVYRARDPRLNREVAIKVLPERLACDPQALARFENEAKAVAALSHPNILAIFDVGADQGVTYAVTELLEGETLRSHVGRAALS